MDLEPGSTRVYHCALCGVDAPHQIRTRRADHYGIACTNCAGGAIVDGNDLFLYQARWEEELRQILAHLSETDDEADAESDDESD